MTKSLEKKLCRRRGAGINNVPDSEHGVLDAEELEFVQAVDVYKRANYRPFPRLTELLFVLRTLGWRKVNG